MLYMDTKTFVLYKFENACTFRNDDNNDYESYILVDELIASAVSELNKKGYETLYTCPGMPKYNEDFRIEIIGNKSEEIGKMLEDNDKGCYFSMAYEYEPLGMYDDWDCKKITSINVGDGPKYIFHERDTDNSHEWFQKEMCKDLYKMVKTLPDINDR